MSLAIDISNFWMAIICLGLCPVFLGCALVFGNPCNERGGLYGSIFLVLFFLSGIGVFAFVIRNLDAQQKANYQAEVEFRQAQGPQYFQEGVADFGFGLGYEQCAYPKDWRGDYWKNGWRHAKREAAKAAQKK